MDLNDQASCKELVQKHRVVSWNLQKEILWPPQQRNELILLANDLGQARSILSVVIHTIISSLPRDGKNLLIPTYLHIFKDLRHLSTSEEDFD